MCSGCRSSTDLGWRPLICASIVSHGHGEMVGALVASLLDFPEVTKIVVTRNIPETLNLAPSEKVLIVDNAVPKGFGANHNAAFVHCSQRFFCPLNPDIEIPGNPFSALVEILELTGAALIAPLVKAANGDVEDSVRYFPTFFSLAQKVLWDDDGRYCMNENGPIFVPEWVAGMFMLFRSVDFQRLGGFDDRFFLYYEDVDICVRAWKERMRIFVCPQVTVVHHAQRASRRELRYFRWHLASMARYFFKHSCRLPVVGASLFPDKGGL